MPVNAAVALSVERLRERAGGRVPRLALLLGSGWDAVSEQLAARAEIAYAELPAFPATGVTGHAGRLRLGTLGGAELILLAGRRHAYEDGDAGAMKGLIRTLAGAGVRTLVQTNAAGSLDPALPPGRLMLVEDHLNIAQRTPLLGEAGDARFLDLADAYDSALRTRAVAAAEAAGVPLHRGVYAWVLGPQFETPAEIRMLQRLGAQAVGMSTVPETILARHAGLRVLALSLITNLGCGLAPGPIAHRQTLSVAQRAMGDALRLLQALLPMLEDPQ